MRDPYYPLADRKSAWYGGRPLQDNLDTVVLHTTEGFGLPGYRGGRDAPNFTAVPDFPARKLRWYQHFEANAAALALVDRPGGVRPNRDGVLQVELAGTSGWASTDNKSRGNYPALDLRDKRWYWAEHAEDWMLDGLAEFLLWVNSEWGVPLVAPIEFTSWAKASKRMSIEQWNRFAGICGHSHVPENDHTDPGALPMADIIGRVVKTAPASTIPPNTREEDMAHIESISPAAAKEIAKALAEEVIHVAVESVSDSAASKQARHIATVKFGGQNVGEAIIATAENTAPKEAAK